MNHDEGFAEPHYGGYLWRCTCGKKGENTRPAATPKAALELWRSHVRREESKDA